MSSQTDDAGAARDVSAGQARDVSAGHADPGADPPPAAEAHPPADTPAEVPSPTPSPTLQAMPGPTPAAAPPPQAGPDAGSRPWRATADDKAVFRRGGPLVLWWLWVAFALFNFFDVAVPDHDYFSFELTAGLLAVTAVVYACALRVRVVADDDAVYVYNPYRDHQARWSAVHGVFLGESVELTCAGPNSKKNKTIYCWALYSGRRSRRRAQQRSDRHEARVTGRTAAEISALRGPDAVTVMASELGRRATAAKEHGSAPATLESRWAWVPVVYLVVPAAALLALALAR